MDVDIPGLLARAVLAPSLAMLLVLALRAPARRAFGARVAYALWLLVPIMTAAAFIPARRLMVGAPEPQALQQAATPAFDPGLPAVFDAPQGAVLDIDFATVLLVLWAAGFAVSLAVLVLDQIRLLSRVRASGARQGELVVAQGLGPAAIGVIAPRIVVPADFAERYSEAERALVLEHEGAHIRAGDLQINALAALVQCLQWFNPVAYAARGALRVDQELACDERVMHRFAGSRRVYAEAMLKAQLAPRAGALACAWPALGERPLRQRIRMLGRAPVGATRRALGAGICAAAIFASGVAVWAVQPPRPAHAATVERGETAMGGADLVAALQDGDLARARRLITAGADVNHWSEGDGTPLVIAAGLEDGSAPAMATALLGAGAVVNAPAPGDGNPLIVAAGRGDMALVRMFVTAGADVNAIVPGDETPLINAARRGRIDAARYLIDHGADPGLAVDVQTLHGMERRSPLSMARSDPQMVRLLRNAGARD